MANKASQRLNRIRIGFSSTFIVLSLSAYTWFSVGAEYAILVITSSGIVGLTIAIAELIIRKFLWKTSIGKLLGFPPDYSGVWEGYVERKSAHEAETLLKRNITVNIKQEIDKIDWHQETFNEDGVVVAESHLVIGEVIDEHRRWDGILGVYEVKRECGRKDTGVSMMTVTPCNTIIRGNYSGFNKHVGIIMVEKKKNNES